MSSSLEEREEVLFGIATVFPTAKVASGTRGGTRRINPVRVADGCLEYSLPFSWSPGQTPDRCDRGQIWRSWQESTFIDTLNFAWLSLIESRQEGRFASRLRSSIPELYRCPRCGHRYPHVCGTEWDRQSYLDTASGRNAEKQISHVKLVKKEKGKGNEDLKF